LRLWWRRRPADQPRRLARPVAAQGGASHLDIADAATALFERTDVTGVVSVGQYPAISGEDLAEAFSARLGRTATYEATDPDAFFAPLAPLLGEPAAAATADMYRALGAQPDRSITAERSAQKRLGLAPRTAIQWLAGIDL
jgi:hypothetical protein